jgi:hypothetical protein
MTLQQHHIKHIKNWQAGGLTQADYCQQNGLNAKTFSRWFRAYQQSSQATEPKLIPIKIKPDSALPDPEILRLRLSGGQSLELPSTIPPRWLAELLQCLG